MPVGLQTPLFIDAFAVVSVAIPTAKKFTKGSFNLLLRIWRWLASNLVAIERLVVITAAILAIFPLWQWWSESEERQLDRISKTIEAVGTCNDTLSNFLHSGEDEWGEMVRDGEWQEFSDVLRSDGSYEAEIILLCLEARLGYWGLGP